MESITKELQRFQGAGCVSLILKTHRTHPENQQDPVVLKNLLKEAAERLEAEYDKSFARARMGQLQKLADAIDYRHNLDGFLLVAGDGLAVTVKMPIEVESRVVIDEVFATRDLVRAMHDQSAYYVAVLSQKQVRLILAFSDRVAYEFAKPFPIQNEHHHPATRDEAAVGNRQDNFIEEFFNRTDKQIQETTKEEPFPIVIAADRRNYDHYQKVTDRDTVIAHLEGSFETAQAHDIVKSAWPLAQGELSSRNDQRIGELRQAVSQHKFKSDLSEIWKAIEEGRGKTLFVERGFFQPARIEGGNIVAEESSHGRDVVDDIIDEMVELNMQYGGEVVFLDKGSLADFQKVALVTRY